MPDGEEGPIKERALEVLSRHWGYDGFRHGQWRAMEAVLTGRDALTILPTGGGKSLCYQVPALLLEGLTVVVSPLVALMDDQVAQLQRRGVRATFINSTLSHRDAESRWNEAMFGGLKLLYLAPERLQTDVFRARADRLNVSLLAVDEAHCISEWGHSFRPNYLKIAEARALIGEPPTMAVTATATPYVRSDICERLELRDPITTVTGFDRPNLTWSVFSTENKRAKVLEILEAVPGCGIVYAGTRRGTEEWAAWLVRQHISSACYHGGLPADVRSAAQEAWIRDECRVMVATNAFGMGIDKPDVRVVIHVDLPGTLESYYQEAGRGGRDGGRAHAVLLYQQRDEDTPKRLLDRSHPDRGTVRGVYDALCSIAGIAIGEERQDPVIVDAIALGRAARVETGMLRATLDLLERQEVLELRMPAAGSLLIQVLQPLDQVRRFAETARPSLAHFVNQLVRALPRESFDDRAEVMEQHLAVQLALTTDRIRRGLTFLAERGILYWTDSADKLLVRFRYPRATYVPYDEALAQKSRARAQTRLADMVRYARGESCRRRYLLSYFGESAAEYCGSCDICLGRHEPFVVTEDHEPMIRQILAGIVAGREPNGWFDGPAPRRWEMDALIAWLAEEDFIRPKAERAAGWILTPRARRLLAD